MFCCLSTSKSYLDTAGVDAIVDAYLFAPPNAGDATFSAAFNELVNARRLPFEFDLVPQVGAPHCTACLVPCTAVMLDPMPVQLYCLIP